MAISLPQDVFSNHIFQKLPIKSAIRFQCVSKQWHSFLSSDTFRKMHNRCHIDEYQNQHKLLLLSETTPYACKFSTIDCDAPENGLTPSRPLPFKAGRYINVLASCHGLVCVGAYSHFILWNPLTNEYKTLPESDSRDESIVLCGLYYSSCEDDYKLLCVTSHYIFTYNFVYIYSLKSDSWRKLDSQSLRLFLSIETWSLGHFLNDNLYFLSEKDSIIRFDTKAEQFTKIATPTFDEDGLYTRCSTMMVLRGCIHFCVSYEIRGTGFKKTCIRLWKMNGDGTWNKVAIYQPVSNVGYLKPLYLMRKRNLLLVGSLNTGNLYTENQGHLYKVWKKNKKDSKGKGDMFSLNSWDLREEVRYIETFVSPNRHSPRAKVVSRASKTDNQS